MASANVLIFGASTRAAAFSALRAGFQPWCADLFGDADLRHFCPAVVLSAAEYPQGFLPLLEHAPSAPWIYTGALENRPGLVAALAQRRPLWGNGPTALGMVRSPIRLNALLQEADLPCPAVARQSPVAHERWVLKPIGSAGGAGIQFWDGRPLSAAKAGQFYVQEYIAGEPYSALFIGEGQHSRLLGITRQLIGLDWFHAKPFQYCGNIGPCPLTPKLRQQLEHLGQVLTSVAGLRGLFGVDYILHDGEPWPVEVNPRYTASVEILEHTLGIHAMMLHARCFDSALPTPPHATVTRPAILGKGILFARDDVLISPKVPWHPAASDWQGIPSVADIPVTGQALARGRPVLTLFAAADSLAACENALRQRALHLHRSLFGR